MYSDCYSLLSMQMEILGFETAKQLVAMNATVVLACRSQDRADAAKKAIVDATLCAPSKVCN